MFFAPFAEEMNRSRRMATLLGEALCTVGIATLVFDYSGTGDSSGTFADARWSDWLDDGRAALAWLRHEIGGPVSVVGLRLGAALALAAVGSVGLHRIVLWQPTASGSVLLTQFLRIRIAASLGEDNRETAASLRERLAAGKALEIAGYDLTPGLANAIDAVRLSALAPPAGASVDWLEVGSGASATLTPASATVIGRWRETGVIVSDATVAGDPFWSIQETTTAPPLVAETVRRLTGGDC